MKYFKLILLIAIITIVIQSCSEDESISTEPLTSNVSFDDLDDVMDLELLESLDSLPVINLSNKDIILPNGLLFDDFDVELKSTKSFDSNVSDVDAKNKLIKEISRKALFLTKREFFQFKNEGENRPEQNGLAFVYGSRQIDERTRYTRWLIFNSCEEYLYGLDCSGYIYRFFNDAGIALPVGRADDLRKEEVIKSAILKKFPDLKLTVDNLGQIPMSEIESGDIVYWKNDKGEADHIGMFINTTSGIVLANSSGHPAKERCEYNKSENGGPVLKDFNYATSRLTNYKYGYSVVRLNVRDSKKVFLRCQSANFDILETEISINIFEDLNEELNVTASDYDGQPLNLLFNINYNKETQTLNLTMTLVNGQRKDSIEIKLDKEDTGYLTMNKLIDNGGCVAQVRIKNNKVSKSSEAKISKKIFKETLSNNF